MIATAIAAALVLASTGASDTAEEEQMEADMAALSETEEAALGWVGLVDRGDYKESWAQAGPIFRSAVTADDWAKQSGAVREPLGKTTSRTVASVNEQANLPGAPEGDYRIVTFNTDFENAADSVETVIFRKDAGSWGVVGYFIR